MNWVSSGPPGPSRIGIGNVERVISHIIGSLLYISLHIFILFQLNKADRKQFRACASVLCVGGDKILTLKLIKLCTCTALLNFQQKYRIFKKIGSNFHSSAVVKYQTSNAANSILNVSSHSKINSF